VKLVDSEAADLPVLAPALTIINQLESEGIIEKPTIGGSIAVMYYATPMLTDDLDVFCYLPGQSLIVSVAPVLDRHWNMQPQQSLKVFRSMCLNMSTHWQ
jgi:hypothetical protein